MKKTTLIEIIVVLLVLVVGYFVWIKHSTSVKTPEEYLGVYSLKSYPIIESPIYNKSSKDCTNSDTTQDARLMRNESEVVVKSILQLVYQNNKNVCPINSFVEILSQPENEKYLYLRVMRTPFGSEASDPIGGLQAIYRLDLSDLSTKNLTIPKVLQGKNKTE